jgi:hypothetical protein
MALAGGTATQLLDVLEVYCAGLSGSSAPCFWMMSRVSTAHTGAITALSSPNTDGPLNPATAALGTVPTPFVAVATNNPIPSSTITDAAIMLGLNLFGGIVRWVAAPGAQYTILGTAAPLGETCWSALNGSTTGTMSSHVIYEPY